MKTVRLSMLLLIAMLLAISPMLPALAGPAQQAAGALTLSVGDTVTGAAEVNAPPQGFMVMRVKVADAAAMAGLQFDLTFNPAILQVAPEAGCTLAAPVVPGACIKDMTPQTAPTFSFAANVDNANGVIHVAIASSAANHGSTFPIADIKFNMVGAANTNSVLAFVRDDPATTGTNEESVVAGDASTPPVPLTVTTVNGKVNVNTPPTNLRYLFDPAPLIAAPGSLGQSEVRNVTLTVRDQADAVVANSPVFLSFQAPADSGSAKVGGTTSLTATPTSFQTNGSGQIAIEYKSAYIATPSFRDTIFAQNAATSPTIKAETTYYYSAPAACQQITLTPNPIAAPGSLAANSAVDVTVACKDGSGAPIPGGTVFLSFQPAAGGGTTALGLTNTPTAFTTFTTGTMVVNFKTPATLPGSGADAIAAQNAASSPSAAAASIYSYGSASPAACSQITLNPNPIAGKGSLGINQAVNVTIACKDGAGAPIAAGMVFLSFAQAPGGGSTTPTLPNPGAPVGFNTNGAGEIVVQYTTPATLPASGADNITAQNAIPTPTVVASTMYEFGTAPVAVARYRVTPYPIAPAMTLAADQVVNVTLTALDTNNAPVPNADVYLDFTGAGSVTPVVGAPGAPVKYTVGNDGKMVLQFKTPASLPSVGAAVIHAANAATSPTIHARTGYGYEAAAQYFWDKIPIAPAQSLAANQTVNLKLTLKKSDGSLDPGGKAWLSLNGAGSANPALPPWTELTADGSGVIAVAYTTPATLPTGGRVTVTAVNSTSTPTSAAITSYEFALPAPTGWYRFDKFPIAQAGNLQPNQSVNLVLTAYDSNGQLTPNVPVFLSLVQTAGGGNAMVAGAWPVTATPSQFATDNDGKIFLAYYTPATMPNQGKDVIVAQDAISNWTKSAKTAYGFAPENGYFFDPAPIANAATLQPGETRSVTLSVKTPAGGNAANAQVYLTFKGAGSVLIGGGPNTIPSQPTLFTTDPSGIIPLTYKAPNPLPADGGHDHLSAFNVPDAPTSTGGTWYDFNQDGGGGQGWLTIGPFPIAPAGTLPANHIVEVIVTVFGGNGQPAPNAPAFLSFTGAGTAALAGGGPALTSTPTQHNADGGGQIKVAFKTPLTLPVSGKDVIVAQDTISNPNMVAKTAYGYEKNLQLFFDPLPIAPPQSLNAGDMRTVTLTVKDGAGNPLPNGQAYLSFKGDGSVIIGAGPATVPSQPTIFTANGSGVIALSYKAPSPLPANGGHDHLSATNSNDGAPTVAAWTYYDFQQSGGVGQGWFTISPFPVAPSGSLLADAPVNVTVAAFGNNGQPAPNTPVFMSFTGAGTANIANGGPALTSAPTQYYTDGAGLLKLVFKTPLTLPLSGKDVIIAQDAPSNPAKIAKTAYAYQKGQSYTFDLVPIAQQGSLQPNQATTVKLTVKDAQNNPAPQGTQVYLAFSGPGAAAISNANIPQNNLTPFFTDAGGQITITHRTPNSLPNQGGHDHLNAFNEPDAPTAVAGTWYDYVTTGGGGGGQIASLVFSPSPIATAGSLAANGQVVVTLTARDGNNNTVANAQVYLTFSGAGSTAPALGPTPAPLFTNNNGQIVIVFTAPATLPGSGSATITAQNAQSNPTLVQSVSYTYTQPVAQIASLVFSPSPIAASGSLTANQQVNVTLTAKDSNANPLPSTQVWLSFGSITNGGSATVGATALTGTPAAFMTNGSGQVAILYQASATLPSTGTIAIRAQDKSSSPGLVSETTYDFTRPVDELWFAPNPIATTGSLAADQVIDVTATAWDISDNAIPGAEVWLSIDPASGLGTATVGATALTGTPAAFTANGNGQIAITYKAPASLPASGIFKIKSQNKSSSPTVIAETNYDFTVPVATITVAKMDIPSGVVTSIPVTVKLDGTKVPLGLGAYSFQVCYNGQVIEVTGVLGGDTPFNSNPTWNLVSGCVKFNALHTDVPGPIGEFTVAKIQVKGLGAGGAYTDLGLGVTSLKDADGANVAPYVANNGSITIRQLVAVPGMALEKDDTDSAAGVSVRIKQVEDKSGVVQNTKIGAFSAKLTYNPSCINIPVPATGNGVRQRNMDIGAVNINNTDGVTQFNGTSTEGVAGLVKLGFVPVRLVGTINDSCDLTLEFTSIKDVDGENIGIKDSATVTMTFRRGDARSDGAVDIADALFIRQYDVGLANRPACTDTVTTSCINLVNAASVKQDGDFDVVDISDALFIAQQDVGIRNDKFVKQT